MGREHEIEPLCLAPGNGIGHWPYVPRLRKDNDLLHISQNLDRVRLWH
jgi:hypothetical protein